MHTEPVEYIGRKRGETIFEIVIPIQKEISCISSPPSLLADLEGEIIEMGDGTLDDFDSQAQATAVNS
ncbi:MAG: hypothetical protein JXA42_12790 [Anaerolineales bacterium]|nr:hypothetical protein [Anaerolineales bacterium]